MVTTRQLRLLRAATASVVATLLAAVSHTVAGGAAPHPLLVLAISCLLVPIAALLVGSRPSRVRVALTVLVSQAVFHLAFQVLGAPSGEAVLRGHEHHLNLSTLEPVTVASSPDALMIASHTLAALVTTALLWNGESMIRAIAGWVLALLRHPSAVFRPGHERPSPLASIAPLLVDTALSASVSRRGPPALV